ncbi:MAG: amidohydrolase [Candidatus Omnitrophica bacterium]|nr:amidohydrolase [Candidatus Omnitrophota bacterium]
MICDAHLHFIPRLIASYSSFYKGIWTDKDKLFKFIQDNNITQALLVYPSTDAHINLGGYTKLYQWYNSEIIKVVKENSKIIGSAIVDIDNLDKIKLQIKELYQKGFRVVNLASSYEGKFIVDKLSPLFECVEKYNMIIFVHPQTINPIGFERVRDPLLMPVLEYSFDISMFMGLLLMGGILKRFHIKFIFSSLGGVVPFLKDRFDRVYKMLLKRKLVKDIGDLPSEIFKKIYVETSGSSLANIKLAMELFGEDKVLFGSDYPANTEFKESRSILDKLDKETKEKILYKNFFKLFKN